ncbi:hypothetical protein KGM_200275B, partial [Danaus plexippus plexippus]
AEEGVRRKLEAGLSSAEARIIAAHPILSRADTWKKEKLAAAAHGLRNELRWTAMEDAANAMQVHKLHQHRYFLLRDLAFLKDREPLLMKELRAAKTPTREFTWATRIWFPDNWTIIRHFRGRSERIPTVISGRATNIVTPRSDPSQPVFLADREKIRTTTTRWPFWRLLNLAHRSWCWTWNMMFVLGVLIPWCSPLSLRTLLCVKPFVPDLELSQILELSSEHRLLGKGMSRQANRIWNYGVIGGCGSLALLLLFPLVSLAASLLSLAVAASVPVWMPPLAVALHAVNALVFDLDCPDPPRLNRWFVLFEVLIWRIGLLGVLQPIVAFIVAVFVCPLTALIMLVLCVSWWCLRGVWEAVSWRVLLVRGARVPAHDSRFCRRVAGPALLTHASYQITAAQALAAVCARGELESLATWATEVEAAIERPLRDYAHFVDACFGPFSVQIAKTGAYKQLEKECSELVWSLREKVATRKRELSLGLSDAARARVRMQAQDLRKAVHLSAVELSRVWGEAASRSDDWWTARGLEPADWHALAANMLVEVFDAEILVALEEGEARVSLEAGPGAARWGRTARDHAPPDVLAERDDWGPAPGVWGEWSGTPAPRVPPPSLEVSAFSPRTPALPPLPPPAAVALVLHNRESDNPIQLDSELCTEILKTLEDAPDCDDRRDDVERYRGGGSEVTSDSSGSDTPDDDGRQEHAPECRISPATERAACRWTLTGRGVRLRADLASPEDVTLDTDRHVGTSV